MAAVFLFSSRTGDESAEDSYFVGDMVGKIFVPGYESWNAEEQEVFAAKIDYAVRKTAHASEYALLGLLTAGVVIGGETSIRMGIFVPWLIASVYAATDEFH